MKKIFQNFAKRMLDKEQPLQKLQNPFDSKKNPAGVAIFFIIIAGLIGSFFDDRAFGYAIIAAAAVSGVILNRHKKSSDDTQSSQEDDKQK